MYIVGNTSPPAPAHKTESAAAIMLGSLRRLELKSRRNLRREIGFVGVRMGGMRVIKKTGCLLSMLLLRGVCVVCFALISPRPLSWIFSDISTDLQMHMPDSLSFEKAATIPLGASTVGQGLYQKALKLNLPTEPIKDKEFVLIYGGSTATGSLAVQYAKL